MRLSAALICALCLLAARAWAEPPSGSYVIPIAPGLVFPSGAAPETCEVTSEGTVCFSTNVATDATGAVTGGGAITIDGTVTADIALTLDGRVSGTTDKPKVKLGFLAAGTAMQGMTALDVRGKGKVKCALAAPGADALSCRGKLKLCAFLGNQKVDCAKMPLEAQLAIERTLFEINLNLVTGLNGGLTGTANVDVGGPAIASYAAKGKYKASADTANAVLKGTSGSAKTKIVLKKVVFEAGSASSGQVVFKLAGQKGKVELPAIVPLARPTCQPAGSFCDVNPDSASLFTSPDNPPPPSNGDTLLFGILGAPRLGL